MRTSSSLYTDHYIPHSYPTRRSSDLNCKRSRSRNTNELKKSRDLYRVTFYVLTFILIYLFHRCVLILSQKSSVDEVLRRQSYRRSEEHTSELQSRFDLVCRLLLEK